MYRTTLFFRRRRRGRSEDVGDEVAGLYVRLVGRPSLDESPLPFEEDPEAEVCGGSGQCDLQQTSRRVRRNVTHAPVSEAHPPYGAGAGGPGYGPPFSRLDKVAAEATSSWDELPAAGLPWCPTTRFISPTARSSRRWVGTSGARGHELAVSRQSYPRDSDRMLSAIPEAAFTVILTILGGAATRR